MSRPSSVTRTEQEPAEAATLLGGGMPRLRAFADRLAEQGEELGLLGPLELPRLWSRHLLNCALMAPVLQQGGSVADVGSGAGLPGLVLAIAREDVRVTLIEPMERRVAWLESESRRLELANVTVLRSRAEDVRPLRAFDQVTARAVSALRTLIPLTAPLARAGGELLLLKGLRADAELRAAGKQIAAAGLIDPRIEVLGAGSAPEETRLFRARVR